MFKEEKFLHSPIYKKCKMYEPEKKVAVVREEEKPKEWTRTSIINNSIDPFLSKDKFVNTPTGLPFLCIPTRSIFPLAAVCILIPILKRSSIPLGLSLNIATG